MLFRSGLFLCTLLTLPSAAVLIGASPAIVVMLLPAGLSHGPLPSLVAMFAVTIIFGSWNALLARYYYAGGDTRTPLFCELAGSVLQGSLLLTLPWIMGITGIAGAVTGGVLSTGILLALRLDRALLFRLFMFGAWSLVVCGVSAWLLFFWTSHGNWPQVIAATLYGIFVFIMLSIWYRLRLSN